MPRIVVNGQDYAAQPVPGTWSTLLETLDRELEPRGFLVTAVRLDGIDVPGFRDEDLLPRVLARDAIVEVEATTPAELLDEGLQEAARSVNALATAAVALATGYRQVDVSQANQHLATFADTLANLMALIAAAGKASHADLDTIRLDGEPASAVVRQLNTTIQELVETHAARDWITLADVLEHDLAPVMGRIGRVIDALRAASAA
jgi:hypothetical protein